MPVTDLSIKIACAKTPTIFGYVIITCCNSTAAAVDATLEIAADRQRKNIADSSVSMVAQDLVLVFYVRRKSGVDSTRCTNKLSKNKPIAAWKIGSREACSSVRIAKIKRTFDRGIFFSSLSSRKSAFDLLQASNVRFHVYVLYFTERLNKIFLFSQGNFIHKSYVHRYLLFQSYHFYFLFDCGNTKLRNARLFGA